MNDIQRKLALIDRELAGGKNLHKQILSTSPLVLIATGLIAGILIQDISAWPIKFWLSLLLVCVSATSILFVRKKLFYQPYATAYMAFFCFLCLGAIRLSSFYQPRPDDISNFVADERKMATIRGLIITEPYTNNYGFIVEPNQPIDVNETDKPKGYKYEYRQWKFARFMHTDPTTSFYLKLKQVQTVAGWSKLKGNIRVQIGEPVLDLKAGDSIQAYCWLDRFKEVTNPGQFDIAGYLARRNIFIAASVESRDSITLVEKHYPGHFTRLKARLREITSQALLGDTQPDSPSQGLLQALLLGYRRNIDNATYEAFRKTGLLHFISLSGMHLGIFIGIIWWLCKTVGLMKPVRAVICIIAIGVFLLIVPPRAPTLRAAIIAVIFCISFFFRRRSNPLNSLSLAAVILLLIRPTQVFEAGWQLSFASVLGIILLADRIHFFIHAKITGISWLEQVLRGKLFFRIITKSGQYLLKLFSLGLAAWLGSAGILLYHFYTITPLASIYTILVFPLVGAILTLGFLKIILFFVLPTLSAILGFIVTILSDWLIWFVKLIASLDISQILIGHVSLTPVILYYSFILFAAFVYFRHPLLKKAICTAMVLAIIIFLGITKWQRIYRNNLILSCLDVGHGQAILAQLPGKANVLFDAGSMHRNDIGRRIVAPFLDYSGINKIDSIIISHNDIDHINGIPEIIKHCEVKGVYANDAFLSTIDTWGTAEFLSNQMHERGLTIRPAGQALDFDSSANISILWPDEMVSESTELSDNDSSLVCLIEFAGRKILLCSDIEEFAQGEFLRLYPGLRADIVVVPHHGSDKVIESEFIKNLDPEILICSCSQRQYERQKAIETQCGSKIFYTAINGAINVCISKDGDLTTEVFVK